MNMKALDRIANTSQMVDFTQFARASSIHVLIRLNLSVCVTGRLADIKRQHKAIGMLHAGVSPCEVDRRFNCHHSTIDQLRRGYLQTRTIKDRPRVGRPPMTTRHQDANTRTSHVAYSRMML